MASHEPSPSLAWQRAYFRKAYLHKNEFCPLAKWRFEHLLATTTPAWIPNQMFNNLATGIDNRFVFSVGIGWLPGMDSNHDSRLQRPLSYH